MTRDPSRLTSQVLFPLIGNENSLTGTPNFTGGPGKMAASIRQPAVPDRSTLGDYSGVIPNW